jgi:hypothetical protein
MRKLINFLDMKMLASVMTYEDMRILYIMKVGTIHTIHVCHIFVTEQHKRNNKQNG